VAFPETIEASLRLGAETLKRVGLPVDNVDHLLRDVRSGDYALVREDGGVPPR